MQETAVQKPDSAMQPEHWYDALRMRRWNGSR